MKESRPVPSVIKFSLVGVLGFGLQLFLLQVFDHLTANYLFATAAAVELTVLHNFIWHEKFTWRERAGTGIRATLWRLARFHISNGAISILGNLLMMCLFAGAMKIPLLLANLLSVMACSAVNFLAGDRWVFTPSRASESPAQPSSDRSAMSNRVRWEKGT
jgi:putative flippase GtrA